MIRHWRQDIDTGRGFPRGSVSSRQQQPIIMGKCHEWKSEFHQSELNDRQTYLHTYIPTDGRMDRHTNKQINQVRSESRDLLKYRAYIDRPN